MIKGSKQTDEIKRKISEKLKGVSINKWHKNNCNCCVCKVKRGIKIIHKINCKCGVCKTKRGENIPWNKGLTKETDKRICNLSLKSSFTKRKLYKRKKYYCKEEGCNKEICCRTYKKGKGRCQNHGIKKLWENKEYRNKQIKLILEGSLIKPTKPEIFLNNLLNGLLPNKYKYVGNGKIVVGGFNPDFLDEKNKKIIEYFGSYWHRNTKERDKKRLETYKNSGYNTLIILEEELNDIIKVKNKILEFSLNARRGVA